MKDKLKAERNRKKRADRRKLLNRKAELEAIIKKAEDSVYSEKLQLMAIDGLLNSQED